MSKKYFDLCVISAMFHTMSAESLTEAAAKDMMRRSQTRSDMAGFLVPPASDLEITKLEGKKTALISAVKETGRVRDSEFLSKAKNYHNVSASQRKGEIKIEMDKLTTLSIPLVDTLRNVQKGKGSYSTPTKTLTSILAEKRSYVTADRVDTKVIKPGTSPSDYVTATLAWASEQMQADTKASGMSLVPVYVEFVSSTNGKKRELKDKSE